VAALLLLPCCRSAVLLLLLCCLCFECLCRAAAAAVRLVYCVLQPYWRGRFAVLLLPSCRPGVLLQLVFRAGAAFLVLVCWCAGVLPFRSWCCRRGAGAGVRALARFRHQHRQEPEPAGRLRLAPGLHDTRRPGRTPGPTARDYNLTATRRS
jgi:hypothetical protein